MEGLGYLQKQEIIDGEEKRRGAAPIGTFGKDIR